MIFAALVLGFWAWLELVYRNFLVDQNRLIVAGQAEKMAAILTSRINQRQAMLYGLQAMVRTHGPLDLSSQHFDQFAASMIHDDPIVRALEFYPVSGPGLIYPIEGNQAVLGRTLSDLLNDDRPNLRDGVRQALESRRIIQSDPYDLRRGGRGITARLAVYKGDALEGLAVIVLNLEPLVSFDETAPDGVEIVYALIDRNGAVFWGEESVLSQHPVKATIALPDGEWRLAAAPRQGWTANTRENILVFWLIGLALAGLTAWVAFLIHSRNATLRRLVAQRTEALAASEARFRSMFENNHAVMLLIDPATLRIIDANPAAAAFYGWSIEELTQKQITDINTLDPQQTLVEMQNAMTESRTFFQFRHRLASGEIRDVEVYSGPVIAGTQTYLYSIIHDVTQIRRFEQDLRHREAMFRAVVENNHDGIIFTDAQGTITYRSPSYKRINGYEDVERVGHNAFETIHPEDVEAVRQFWARMIDRPGQVLTFEYRTRHKNGTWLWIESTGKNMLDVPDVNAIVVSSRDITERKAAQEEIQRNQQELKRLLAEADESRRVLLSVVEDQRQAEENLNRLNAELEHRVAARTVQLESALKELEAFSYSVSHDLRAPLRGINGWSLALMEDYASVLDDRAQLYLNRVRDETTRMGQLIDDILRLARISRFEMNFVWVDLSAMAEKILERLCEDEPREGVRIEIEEGIKVRGDANLLEIALTNLLSNAYKFTGKQADTQIQFGSCVLNGAQVYFVKDNGAGFDMAYAKNLFGAFQRMHKQSDFPGTGIGLATVQRIIHRHGGKVWAEAQKGQGATFYFTLPADFLPDVDGP